MENTHSIVVVRVGRCGCDKRGCKTEHEKTDQENGVLHGLHQVGFVYQSHGSGTGPRTPGTQHHDVLVPFNHSNTMLNPWRPMHDEVNTRIQGLLEGETDWVAAMATVVCELHHGFDHFHWTGFYRTTEPGVLKIGPYQGGHGCLYIPYDKGICGAAARTGQTQDVPDVHARLNTLRAVQPPTAKSWFR